MSNIIHGRFGGQAKFDMPVIDDSPVEFRTIDVDAEEMDDGTWTVSGKEGLPWSRGQLRLEHNPDLQPVRARGLSTDPGALWKMRAMPQVAAALDDLIGTVATAPWRIMKPSLLPWHEGSPDAERALLRQWMLARRLWWSWTKASPEYDFLRWITDMLTYSAISGFYIGEAGGELETVDLGEGPQELVMLRLPELRAPWTVYQWVLQGDEPVGIVQRLPWNIDMQSTTLALPWRRIVHFTMHDAGRTDFEGYSIVRPAYQALRALQDGYQLQALAVSVNALGTWIGEAVDLMNPPDENDLEKIATHFSNSLAEHVPYLLAPKLKLRLETASDSVPDLTPQLGIYERLAMLSLGQSHKLIGLHQHGSFAARASAADDARESYVYPAERLKTTIRRYFRKAIEAALPDEVAAGYLYTPEIEFQAPEVEETVR